MSLNRLWLAINTARPRNGFTRNKITAFGVAQTPDDASLLLIMDCESNGDS